MLSKAIAQLQIALDTVETNAPINEAAGNADQAKLERECAVEYKEAIAILEAHKSTEDGSGGGN